MAAAGVYEFRWPQVGGLGVARRTIRVLVASFVLLISMVGPTPTLDAYSFSGAQVGIHCSVRGAAYTTAGNPNDLAVAWTELLVGTYGDFTYCSGSRAKVKYDS